MFLLLLSLIGLLDNVSGKSLDFSIHSRCDFPNTRDECLNKFGCMWCNNTNDTYLLGNNTDGYCRNFDICNLNESNYPGCEAPNYYNECNFLKLLYYSLLIFGFMSSIILLLYTNYKLLIRQNIDIDNINRIQALIATLLLVPFILLYIYYTMVFYYYLMIMIVFSLIYSCCFYTGKHAPNYYRRWARTNYSLRYPHDQESEKLLN